MPFYLTAFLIVASVLLGGGTRSGFLSDFLLQILAIPVLVSVAWTACERPLPRSTRVALIIAFTLPVLALLQLVPLPAAVWSALPHRHVAAEGFELAGAPLPWMPLSLAPAATWLSLLSVLPPLAVFVGIVMLGRRQRRHLSVLIIALALVSVFLGLLQVAQGPDSPLRFFAVTNPTEAVGFFANRNHFSALLYAAMPFAAAWAINLSITAGPHVRAFEPRAVVLLVISFTVIVVLIAGQTMARSRAGLALTIIALFGAFAMAVSDRRATSGLTPIKLLGGATALAGIFAAQYALFRLLERFEKDPLEDARIVFARNTFEAASAFMPFGSGLGSFVPVYGLFEKPADTLANTYANHAHNDIVQFWLETGVVGLLLMGLFTAWLVWRSVQVWRAAPAARIAEIDQMLMRAATLVIALLLAHSFVDYPLRTGAMMAIMAYACALLIEPPIGADEAVSAAAAADVANSTPPPHKPRRRAAAVVSPAPAASRSVTPDPEWPRPSSTRWGAEVEWPEAWRKPTRTSSSDPATSRDPQDD